MERHHNEEVVCLPRLQFWPLLRAEILAATAATCKPPSATPAGCTCAGPRTTTAAHAACSTRQPPAAEKSTPAP